MSESIHQDEGSQGPATNPSPVATEIPRWLWLLGNIFGAVWIVGGMSFFLLRFSAVLYHANQETIDEFLMRWLY